MMKLPFDEGAMRAFGALIVRLQKGGDLTREETRDAYVQIFKNQQPELQQGAFIGAHKAKGGTADELVGLTDAHYVEWSAHFPFEVAAPEPHLGILGTGMDTLKSINVSSAASVVAAACGAYVHKVGAPGMTGPSGSADAFMLWGVDPFGPLEQQVKSVEACRLGFTSPITPHLRGMGLGRVLKQLRCGTVIHYAGPMDRHSGEMHKIIGVATPDLVDMFTQAMKGFGYTRGLVPCGGATQDPTRHMDEFSTVGPTEVGELKADGTIERYTLTPADLGVEAATIADIAAEPSREANARAGALTLAGKGRKAHTDLVAVNAGACLYVLDKVGSIAEGTALAQAAIADGRAIEQLRALIRTQNAEPEAGLAKLEALLA